MSTRARTKKAKERAKIEYRESLPAFEVIKVPFKYNGKAYHLGDEWKPEGGAWDDLLIKQEQFVMPVKNTEAIRAQKVKQANQRLEQMPGYQEA